jgi:hypothetical protein
MFFDPTSALPARTCGEYGASMYVFDEKLAEGYRRGHSLVVARR